MGRKLFFAGVMVVVMEGSALQIAVGLLACFVVTLGYVGVKPFAIANNNNLHVYYYIHHNNILFYFYFIFIIIFIIYN